MADKNYLWSPALHSTSHFHVRTANSGFRPYRLCQIYMKIKKMALTSLVLISRLFIISSLSSPYASSTVYFPFKCDNVVSVMWIFPGLPPDSIRLAIVTASDQTSNCHFFKPKHQINYVLVVYLHLVVWLLSLRF